MHILFLAPDTHGYNHRFVRGLKSIGARVSGIGLTPRQALPSSLRAALDGYEQVGRILEDDVVRTAAGRLAGPDFDRIETIDEPLVELAARLRGKLGVPGLSARTATLCRDKVAMKELLREHAIPCAASTAVGAAAEAFEFAEREGFPLIIKPIAGFGSLNTYRVESASELGSALKKMGVGGGARVAIEEYVEGHEGFFDTIVGARDVHHDFVSHYFPGCLEAAQKRWVSPQIAVTNRIDYDAYREVREVGRKVVRILGIECSATHMEWFFGPKGLKVSEIGSRPAGEKIWDMYGVANDFDVYREWALAIVGRPPERRPSRRFAVGSIQVRPDGDGVVSGYSGLHEIWQACREAIYESEVPKPGSPTKPLDKGWLVNTWFRLRHVDYDELRRLMDFIGDNLRVYAVSGGRGSGAT